MNFWDPDQINKAWYFATIAHQNQTYGGHEQGLKINYINHIGSVAMEVMWALSLAKNKYDANLALQCAILHDIIEDTEITYSEIESKFSNSVATGVMALTKNSNLPTKEEQILDSIKRIKNESYEIWMVKLADRITNLYHPPYYWSEERIINYKNESLLIYNELKEANDSLSKRLFKKISEYGQLIT